MTEDSQSSGIDLVEGFLSQYGWKYERLDDLSLITGFKTEMKTFSLFLRLSREWLLFSILDYVSAPLPQYELSLLRHLARSNMDTVFAKLATDDEGNVVVVADIPIGSLSYDVFIEALEAFCFFAEETFAHTSKAANELISKMSSENDGLRREESSSVPANE